MKFEQTGIFSALLKAFTKYGEDIRNDSGRTEEANNFTARFVKMYGVEKIAKVCTRANKSLKAKIF